MPRILSDCNHGSPLEFPAQSGTELINMLFRTFALLCARGVLTFIW